MNDVYKKKVELLLRILPFVTDEECFAIHGGTAINLFVKNLNRLSVDIDVTYLPLEDRATSLKYINEALMRIADKTKRSFSDIRVISRLDICKITCERQGCRVKIEVNQTKRGLVCGEARLYPLCEKGSEAVRHGSGCPYRVVVATVWRQNTCCSFTAASSGFIRCEANGHSSVRSQGWNYILSTWQRQTHSRILLSKFYRSEGGNGEPVCGDERYSVQL